MMQNLFKMNVMTNILKYTFAAGAAVLMLASCDLNLTPESAIAYEEGKRLFVSESDITAFDNGLHASFRAMFYGANSQTSEIMCDGFNATVNYNNHYGAEHMANETFNAGSQFVETVWANNYGAIKNYNIAIANADNVDPSLRAAARYLKGDGYFYRACSYLTLARHFAKAYDASTAGTELCVPLVLVYNQLEKPARATVKAVYDQIKADLDSAAVIFAKVEGEARAMAPTIDAVNAVLQDISLIPRTIRWQHSMLRRSFLQATTHWLLQLQPWIRNILKMQVLSLSCRCTLPSRKAQLPTRCTWVKMVWEVTLRENSSLHTISLLRSS